MPLKKRNPRTISVWLCEIMKSIFIIYILLKLLLAYITLLWIDRKASWTL